MEKVLRDLMTTDPMKSVEGRIALATVKYPELATILADDVHGGWMGNEIPIDAIIGSDAALRQAIWEYSMAVQMEGNPGYFRKNARTWYNLLCLEQVKRINGGRCDSLTEYQCQVWQASFAKSDGMVKFSCSGCEQGKAHETTMQEWAGYNLPVYAPIDGMMGGR